MENIESITICDERGYEDECGNNVTVCMKNGNSPTIEEETYVFDVLLKYMKLSGANIYYYIDFVNTNSDPYNDTIEDNTSFELAKKLGRTQEIRDIVNSWLE